MMTNDIKIKEEIGSSCITDEDINEILNFILNKIIFPKVEYHAVSLATKYSILFLFSNIIDKLNIITYEPGISYDPLTRKINLVFNK